MKTFRIALVAAICLAVSAPAFIVGCGSLAPEGVYQGDDVLYKSELAITTSYDVIHGFVSWEKKNRTALSVYPKIKLAADTMRANSKQWFASANALHDSYASAPTPENESKLNAALAVLRTALAEASGYMALAAGS